MRFSSIAALAGAVFAPFLSACVGLACTEEARSSVDVTVVDAMGMAQKDALVTFSVDGAADEEAECISLSGGGAGPCDSWVAGYERSGSFTIKASSADGTKHAQKTVTVAADECHVITQIVTLTLE